MKIKEEQRRKLYILKDFMCMARDRFLKFPHEIKVELTYRCNQNCDFCFNKNVNKNKPYMEMDKSTIFFLLKKIRKEGIRRIRLTGGEPLLRKDFIAILDYAKRIGLIVKLNTNGDLINSRNINKIKECCDEILFSLHDKKTLHDKMLISNMKKIANNISARISTIAIKENILDYETYLNTIKKINPDYWYWNYPIPNHNHKAEFINWQDIFILKKKIKETKSKIKIMGIRFPLCKISSKDFKFITGCKNCGPYDHLVINPEGKIHLCNSVDIDLGNIFNDNILEIWRKNKLIQEFQNKKILPKECQDCKKADYCRGGCRYSAYLHAKKIKASKHPLMEINLEK